MVRIHLPPAESQANFGTWVIGGQGAATHRRHPWSGERVVNASASDNPSGRNLWAASKRRPRITSSSMSQRTRLEDWMQRAYRLPSETVSVAVIICLLTPPAAPVVSNNRPAGAA